MPLSPPLPPWELAAEAIAVRIRWAGLVLGTAYVNIVPAADVRPILNAILLLGFLFTVLDTWYSWRGRVYLGRYPLLVSLMEAIFVGLLCAFESGPDSPFRYYYLLSLVCCAIRHPSAVTAVTCLLHCVSYAALTFAVPSNRPDNPLALPSMLVALAWVAWAASAMSRLVHRIGEDLGNVNDALRENQAALENRINERTRELHETQAQMWHQEKMAAFGLLAAGIAHEVGNPLTSISTVVQLLEKGDLDDRTRDKLRLVGGQLQRIQGTLRELIDFSRPASKERTRVAVSDIVLEAMKIAKYYKGMNSRIITAEIPEGLPPLFGVRDQLVQVVFNLILNAIDATGKGGRIEIRARLDDGNAVLSVRDNGTGIPVGVRDRLFQPYFTTKEQGTGLGLFVTRKLVTEHGGGLSFESADGAGTEFRVRLPLPPTRSDDAPDPAGQDARVRADR